MLQSQTNFAVPHFAAHTIAHLLPERFAFGAAAIMSVTGTIAVPGSFRHFFLWRRSKFLLKENDLKRMIQVWNDDTDNGEQEPSFWSHIRSCRFDVAKSRVSNKEVMKEQGFFQ